MPVCLLDDYHIVGCDGIFVDLDGVGAIFLGITLLDGFGGQLAWLAHGHKAGPQSSSQHASANEAPRLDANNLGDALVLIELNKSLFKQPQALRVLEECCQVLELHARDREVGYVSDDTLEFCDLFLCHIR